ncbi:MAG TPA: right-handed parallel beta-helix repeat-containing protein, partial [Pseudonocardiaceae bacterium]
PSPAAPADPGAVGEGRVPQPGQVGFRGDPAGLTVVDGPGSAPPGTRWDGGVLYVDGGDVTLDGLFVKGGVEYDGDGTLTIRDSVIEGNKNMHSPVIGDSGHVDIRDSTIRWKGEGLGGSWGNGAVHGDARFTVIRCDISGTPDGIQTGSHGSLFEQNWIHDLAMFGTYPNETHNDGIQSYGGRDVVIRYNRIDLVDKGGKAYNGHQNAALFFMPDPDWPLVNPQIVGNYLAGGGFTLRLGAPTTNAVVTGNRFGPTTGGWGELLVEGAQISRWADNVDVNGKQLAKP